MIYSEIRKKTAIMGISMNNRTNGFRKWSEAHDPKIAGARAVAVEAAVISAPELEQGGEDSRGTAASSVARAGGRYALKRTPILSHRSADRPT
jgi:hypothetical protein